MHVAACCLLDRLPCGGLGDGGGVLPWHNHPPWWNPKNIAYFGSKKHADFYLNLWSE